jgi:hypothetical protein
MPRAASRNTIPAHFSYNSRMHPSEQKVSTAVERLNHILPLAARQQALDSSLRQLHQAVLRAYVDVGRSLMREEMAQQVDDIEHAVHVLKDNDLVVFDHRGEPTGAYPFTMEAREHTVHVNGHSVHCMCALDALAVSPMFNLPTAIRSRCQVTQDVIELEQQGLVIDNEAGDIFFAIDWSAASGDACCADSLCTEMIFLKGAVVAQQWLAAAEQQRQTFSLAEAVDFAARFFRPLLNE